MDFIFKLLKLPIVKILIGVLLIAVWALWGERTTVEEKSEQKADKDIVRHDNIIAKRDSIVTKERKDCAEERRRLEEVNAKKDSIIAAKDERFNVFLQQMLDNRTHVDREAKKANKEVVKAITTVTHLRDESQPKQPER